MQGSGPIFVGPHESESSDMMVFGIFRHENVLSPCLVSDDHCLLLDFVLQLLVSQKDEA